MVKMFMNIQIIRGYFLYKFLKARSGNNIFTNGIYCDWRILYLNYFQPLRLEERNLIDLEMMIMEQVADWELEVGKVEAESSKKSTHLLCSAYISIQ